MPIPLRWWEQFTRELLWVWAEQGRALVKSRLIILRSRLTSSFWLKNQAQLQRVEEYARREQLSAFYREYLALSWINLALSFTTRVALRKIQALRIQWVRYWSGRPRTAIGARAITKLEAFEAFSTRYYR